MADYQRAFNKGFNPLEGLSRNKKTPFPSPRFRIDITTVDESWEEAFATDSYADYWAKLGKLRKTTSVERIRVCEDGQGTWININPL